MRKKRWIAWALFLLMPGTIGLSIHFARKSSLQNRIALASERVSQDSVAQKYIEMHDQWIALPATEKADNPWGYGSYGGPDIQRRLQDGQQDRLTADLPVLEKGVTRYPDEMASVLYGQDWQSTVENYKKQLAVSELILIVATFLLAVGGLILAGGFVRIAVSYLLKRRAEKKEEAESCSDAPAVATQDIPEDQAAVTDLSDSSEDEDDKSVSVADTVDSAQPLINESTSKQTDDIPSDSSSEETENSETGKDKGYFKSHKKVAQNDTKQDDKVTSSFPTKPLSSFSSKERPQKDSYFGWAVDLDDSSDLENLMTTEPLTKELTELTEEVSAIRQFAAQQQDQMRKLQDGYDWMIIRRFCLRIIRSIDNIDDRVNRLQEQGDDAAMYLEDIRDELIFALESSGIEQFKPDLNMPFKGLEKYAEAVRERVLTDDESLAGAIAEVARPGYQYLVNDDDVKIVRCAQVKLYETTPTE